MRIENRADIMQPVLVLVLGMEQLRVSDEKLLEQNNSHAFHWYVQMTKYMIQQEWAYIIQTLG